MSKEIKRLPLEDTFITDANLVDIQTAIGLPNDVSGLRVLDIGSGASTVVEGLSRKGAQAYGIDPIYTSKGQIFASYQRSIKKGNTDPDFASSLERSVEKFIANRLRSGRYIAASATDLPFRDSSIDLIYSHQCLSAFLIRDRGVFLRAIEEAMRVLKSGGQLRIHPWYLPLHERQFPSHPGRRMMIPQYEWSANEIRNTRAALTYLKKNNHRFAIEDNVISTDKTEFWGEVDVLHQPRLVIIKA